LNITELETRMTQLENQMKALQTLQDVEDIKKLQRAYGYYLINWMHEELIDCFADSPDTILEWPQGTFLGKAGARRFFGNINKKKDPEFMHQMMQLSGIVTVAPGGKTARGRWWGFGAMAIPAGSMSSKKGKGVSQAISCGIYEMGYIKESGVWKILKMKWVGLYNGSLGEGWVKPERLSKDKPEEDSAGFPASWQQDGPPIDITYEYPSGNILPFHFKHPVTGKVTTEGKRNAALKKKK
jgi:hypothetical protein